MLFRVVRPMKRKSSRAAYFVQRIPVDVKARVVGRRLAIPFGGGVKFVTPSPRAQSISFSLRTNDPAEVKILQANIAAHLETIWTALREDAPIKLSHRQATALAGELYRVWADGEIVREASLSCICPVSAGSVRAKRKRSRRLIGPPLRRCGSRSEPVVILPIWRSPLVRP